MDKILKQLGNPGIYHFIIAALLAITWWSVALGNVAMTFYGITPTYVCDVSGEGNLTFDQLNNTLQTTYTEDESTVRRHRRDAVTVPVNRLVIAEDQCSYTILDGESSNSTYKCTKWLYNDSHVNGKLNTITTEVSFTITSAVGSAVLRLADEETICY